MGILAINVRKLRKMTGLTQGNLSTLINVGETTINNIESGYLEAPPEKILEKIAMIFGTTSGAFWE